MYPWSRVGIASRRLIINDTKALVHTVSETAYLVSPGVLLRYAQEHPSAPQLANQDNVSDWLWIQKRFEKLQFHRKQNIGLNIWTCEVTGPHKSRRLHGYLLSAPREALNETCGITRTYPGAVQGKCLKQLIHEHCLYGLSRFIIYSMAHKLMNI